MFENQLLGFLTDLKGKPNTPPQMRDFWKSNNVLGNANIRHFVLGDAMVHSAVTVNKLLILSREPVTGFPTHPKSRRQKYPNCDNERRYVFRLIWP
ncbi:MAG: hypothetical protein K8U57_28950 [Planctomycetes bacterium]|nr:hypothetical protein [Planctomycetota bacterium]